ncbi:MAG: phage holin family protein [Hydrogenophaga sp.]|uniref:hypothetical protein n=2 Tax=Hydrogenophaga sp. TaxID=1904254 RepID=UPI0025BD777D|nr:hypothetical protein [Hydrogenophaga sp.]MBT9549827.1 phage holin family protein [Hydrogenophaga sp.]
MIHPLFISLAQQPTLFTEHADAYADLALAEWQGVTGQLKSRALIWVATAVLGLVGLLLLGTSLLLWAVVPMASMPMPWLLWVVPAVPLLGAGVFAGVAATRRDPPAFEALRTQWAQDMATLKILGEE